MDPQAAKLIGAGLATIPLFGVGIGLGLLFGNFLQGALRNPGAAPRLFANAMLFFALIESVALFALVVAMLILFVF
ncbi:ATP synthase subunit C family protein [Zavarzinia sp. CC-PAN008]|uniref:ATP synthase subunit C family protein n=1 Tax=Zavarzinia sp. CC-PAN008 TaxID=3243332 RepID=UPI003F74A080